VVEAEEKGINLYRDRYSTERIKAFFGSRMLSEIRRHDIEDYVVQGLTAGRLPATVNRELCCLKNILQKAVDWEYIEKNPAWGVKQQRESPPEFKFVLADEIERLIAAYTPELQALATLAINQVCDVRNSSGWSGWTLALIRVRRGKSP